jgi:thiol-disulfide isomerase/thioredoxin
MLNQILIFLFFIMSKFIFANETIVIQGFFLNNSKYTSVSFEKFNIGSHIVATSKINDGSFIIEMPSKIEPGIYRLKYSQVEANSFFDIIINGTERKVTFTFDFNSSNPSPIFESNSENAVYYNFLMNESERVKALLVQQFFLQNYPSLKDDIFNRVNKNYFQEINKIKSERSSFIKKNKNLPWASALIKNKPIHFSDDFRKDQRIIEFENYEKYWEKIDVNNERLLNTPIFVDHILVYLQYYLNSNLGLNNKEIEIGLKTSIDSIMLQFSATDKIQEFAIRYLIDGFNEIGYVNIVEYIYDKYANQILKFNIQRQSETKVLEKNTSKKLEIGSVIPNVEWKSKEGNSVTSLHQINAEEIVLIFWSSDCPHCDEAMKKADEWAIINKNKVVLAIGIEHSKEQYLDKIKEYKNIWHYSDFKGFESSLLNNFMIESTPTFFIIDENKRIIDISNSFL